MAIENENSNNASNSPTPISERDTRSFRKFPAFNKIDVAFVAFMGLLFGYYVFYISTVLTTPIWDGAVYLLNGRAWLSSDTPLYEGFRPPLLSWIIAGIGMIAGTENWEIIKFLQPIFTVSAGVILYLILKMHKGRIFAFAVTALTMLNATLFFNSSQIYTEGLSLFFLVLTLYLLASKKSQIQGEVQNKGEGWRWLFAGLAIGLTFASRYPIIVPAITIFIVASALRKDIRLVARTIVGAASVIAITVLVVYLKTGTFQTALTKDTHLSALLSPFYLTNSVDIWGLAILLVPIAFIFKKTYTTRFNYLFIAWFIVSLAFWSANTSDFDYRFTIQFTPAVYYLVVLAIEYIWKHQSTIIRRHNNNNNHDGGSDAADRENKEAHVLR